MMLVTLLALAQAAAAPTIAIPDGPALTEQIRKADAALFDLYFTGCDPAALTRMVAPDLEFYHDKGGFTDRSGTTFVADYARKCRERQAPDAWRSRRTLVPGSLFVQAIPGYGAIEEGDNEYWERQGSGPEKKVGRSHFVMLWRKDTDGWRLSRVLSYRHEAVN